MTIKASLKRIFGFILVLVVCLFILVSWYAHHDRAVDYEVKLDAVNIPQFDEQAINFIPTYEETKTLPFIGSAVIDIDNDGIEEIFIGGGINQQDAIFRFDNGNFINITEQTGWEKSVSESTYSAIALDVDDDGYTDLLVSRPSGVWLYKNTSGKFTAQHLDLTLDKNTVPLSVAVADLNRDGLYDLYVSGYIAREQVKGETIFNQEYGGVSALFINMGNNTFHNITKEAGLYNKHNTFQSMFTDVDADGLEDLIVAQDTGKVLTWKNAGGLTFKNILNPTSNSFSYPMGIAVSDYNNDGLPDFFFSNVGSTTPEIMVRGDLNSDQLLNRKWIMLENKGDFVFDDVAQKVKLADYEFSWGAVFQDFNLDGRDDLVVSENYVGFPLHALPIWRLDGRFLLQNNKHEFAEASDKATIKNRSFGISPITADFNQDGYPDFIHINLLGQQKAFISKPGNDHYLKIKLPNNVQSIGAKIAVTLVDGRKIFKTFTVGQGLCSDQSHVLIFGLGGSSASEISVTYLDGRIIENKGRFENVMLSL